MEVSVFLLGSPLLKSKNNVEHYRRSLTLIYIKTVIEQERASHHGEPSLFALSHMGITLLMIGS